MTTGGKLRPDGTQGPSPRIGNDVEIDAGAIIIGDISIGSNVIVGAGSVVTRDVPEWSMVMGNPDQIIARNRDNVPASKLS